MSVVFILLPVALFFAMAAVGVFVWAVRDGQLDDLETPGVRVLHDDARAVQREG
jgi:cbb3-type cytochrome oxidase maturation protein